ncbi:penicillin-binding protein 2 [candidate division WOR-3 bacterium]|nr:penicillin-binding protein 2 [candidate division WOR-3 bacterium]MCK4527854.1 penicillin-binding protein 2 [candidate division WOR-3 bacterium]
MKRIFQSLVVITFIFLLGRLFQLQILKKDYYEVLSEKDRLRMEIIPAPRGKIFSREGIVLADSRPSYSIFIDPYEVDSSEINYLAEILNISKEVIYKKIRPHFRIGRIRRVSFDAVSRVVESQEKFPAVRVITEPARYYPFDNIFSHLLGYTGEVNDEELKRLKGYVKGDMIGKNGVEKQYDCHLREKKGVSYVEVDAMGRVVKRFDSPKASPPQRGMDTYLSVSADLTLFVDSLLSDFSRAAVVAMEPKTGEILLYYSKPGYSANKMTSGISLDDWDSLRNREDAPLWDRIICGEYPPGSIFKIPTTIIALRNGIVTEYTTFNPCEESLWIGDRYFCCWKKHNKLRLLDAIIQSCDIYFYQVGMKMTLEQLVEGAKKLKFEEKCGIDIPGERRGFLPSRDWYNNKYGGRGWDRGVLANLAIGQGEVLLTPLQIVVFFSAIANNGKTFTPHILKEIRDRDGRIVLVFRPKKIDLGLSSFTVKFIKKAMKGVLNNRKGTAYGSRLRGITIAGKTGTAENPHGEDHSLFVSFAPFENPEIVVFTVIENIGHGSAYAAPVTTKIIKKYLSMK